MTGAYTPTNGWYAFVPALCVCFAFACASSHERAAIGSARAEGGEQSGGGDTQSYGTHDSDAFGAPAGPALAQATLESDGEMAVTTVASKSKVTKEGSSPAPAPMAPTPGEPERDTSEPKQHGLALIYDARVHLGVFESQRTIDAAETLARDAGGYLVHRDQRRITVRVPADKFQATLAAVLLLGDVLHREVSVRDVTEEFRDLRIRLRNAEVVRDRLEQLLARADKVEQALAVERELERVAGQIEQIKGRLSMLQELIAFSTVTIELRPRATDHLESRVRLPFPWLDELGLSGLLSL